MKSLVWVVLLALGGIAVTAAFLPGLVSSARADVSSASQESPMSEALIKEDLQPGAGPAIANGQTAVVHYTGWLFDANRPENKGRKFDSSRDRGDPFGFNLGAGQVIAGWDQGVAGMRVGGQRTLTIPPELGYGARGAGGVIPPNATLVFDVELLDVR